MRNARGLTLVELLTVIAVIAVLLAILCPVFAKALSYVHSMVPDGSGCTQRL